MHLPGEQFTADQGVEVGQVEQQTQECTCANDRQSGQETGNEQHTQEGTGINDLQSGQKAGNEQHTQEGTGTNDRQSGQEADNEQQLESGGTNQQLMAGMAGQQLMTGKASQQDQLQQETQGQRKERMKKLVRSRTDKHGQQGELADNDKVKALNGTAGQSGSKGMHVVLLRLLFIAAMN
jgi:hypothetical protein